MEVDLIKMHHDPPEIRQSRPRRDWMDATYKKHAYKCLPLTAANTHGWELILPEEITGTLESEVSVPKVINGLTRECNTGPLHGDHEYERDLAMPSIVGILSIATDWIFRPPEGYSTFISGSPNFFLNGAVPLTAMITGWWPDPFAMNWKITTVGSTVTFPKGMPYMWFTFVKDDALPDVKFNTSGAWENPDELIDPRVTYNEAKSQQMIDNPWTWMGSIRTGLDEKGERIGPNHEGHPVLDVPEQGRDTE